MDPDASGPGAADGPAMTRVDFHVNVADKIGHGCRLVRKIREQGLHTVVFCEDAIVLRTFDEALWTFDPLEFIPHVPAGHPLAARTPVLLTARDTPLPDSHYGVLVNLGRAVPPFYSRFERLVELVGDDDDDRTQGRIRWRGYRDRGYPLASHDLARRDSR